MMMVNRRRVMGGGKPYDYEVEYLGINGEGPYIQTDIMLGSDSVIDVIYKGKGNVFGTRNTNYATVGVYNQTLDLYYPFNTAGRIAFNNDGNTVYKVHVENSNRIIRDINDNIIATNTWTSPSFSVGYRCPIFAIMWDGNNRILQNGNPLYIYRISFTDKQNSFLLDFIPVVKNGVGYLYDKVSGQLFGNAGTGSFIAGPRKS